MRSGHFVKQATGYRAFIPAPLPPNPPIELDANLTLLLSQADRALGRLDGAASILPNPNLFVAMYVRQEAVLSSQIEGTQSTLEDVLQFEIDPHGQDRPKDIQEVVNYIHAMNYGLERLQTLPLSLRLIREIHEKLLHDVRGSSRNPGEFRTSQNWIGPAGSNLSTASFVPPPAPEMHQALGNLEHFLYDSTTVPVLILCGLAHAQFETIHPFLDGNGRVGRLLITFLLCQREILQYPLLYLSHYFKRHRAEYYDRLTAIRIDGDWEGWLRFFLKGIFEVSQASTTTARAIMNLREQDRLKCQSIRTGALPLLEYLYKQPIITVQIVKERLNCAYATANKLVEQLRELGIVEEITGGRRNRLYRYGPYLALFDQDTQEAENGEQDMQRQATQSKDTQD
jgi:Fic family protein